MILVIQTQDYENYAAHEGFTGAFRWKAKGGSEYKITDIPQGVDPDEVLEMVRAQIERNDEYFQTFILGHSLEQDDYLSWFEQSQLNYEGEIRYREPTIEYSELNGVAA